MKLFARRYKHEKKTVKGTLKNALEGINYTYNSEVSQNFGYSNIPNPVFLGKQFEIIGGAVIAIIAGMIITLFWKEKGVFEGGIKFTSKKILQWAVILLGFGLNLGVVYQTGIQSLPIIVCTITISLLIAFVLHKVLHIPGNISTLIGCGSSICGGSAVAATASVIDADDEEVAQAISVIFFFNVSF